MPSTPGTRNDWFTKAPTMTVRWQELLSDTHVGAMPLAAQMLAVRMGAAVFIFGGISDDPHTVARLTMTDVREVLEHWDTVRPYFRKDAEGFLTHDWWIEHRTRSYMRQTRAKIAGRCGRKKQLEAGRTDGRAA